jgi:hypothetical protein
MYRTGGTPERRALQVLALNPEGKTVRKPCVNGW